MARTPIIGLAGKAGSGKSTVAKFIADKYNAVEVAQADVMKRFIWRVFENFTIEDLWGPSELRNKSVDLTDDEPHIYFNFTETIDPWLDHLLENKSDINNAKKRIEKWLDNDICPKLKTITPRYLLQSLGTEVVRNFKPTVWSDHAIATAFNLLTPNWRYERAIGLIRESNRKPYNFVVISDVRFLNECLNINKINGINILIKRPDLVKLGGEEGNHSSETELDTIPKHFFDTIVWNDGSLQSLYGRIDEIVKKYYPQMTSSVPYLRVED